MELQPRHQIALLVETSRDYGRELLRGVALFARTRTCWSLLHQEMSLDSVVPDWVRTSGIKGAIARVDKHTIDPLRALNVPIIDVRCNHRFQGVPQVDTDNEQVAELAFRHLWDRGFRRFAFCGFELVAYSEARLQAFRKLAKDANCLLDVYESTGAPNTRLTGIEQSGIVDVEPMQEWLTSLSRPTGLFVCNDIRGQQVLNVCRTLEIAVPDDIGVIGVDDDDTICLLSDPALSSVRPDAARVGYRAAEILHEMIAGKPGPTTPECIPPVSVAERLSTKVIAVEDEELARVCRFVRQHACEGINVGDITEFSTLSRRQLERRFRDELGRTPHEHITATQIERVKQLLRETAMTLEQISPMAGFSHRERLSTVFKRETGETPGEYRRENGSSPRD